MKYLNFNDLNINSNTKVLVVFPHPDDEVMFAGGFMQNAIKTGAKVRLICLTKGEASTLRFGLKENDDLGQARTEELKTACRILGVADFEVMDFEDGKLQNHKGLLEERIKSDIENYKPNYVVTYEPHGAYGHPDHIVVSDIITELNNEQKIGRVATSDDDTKWKLLYATVTPEFNFSEDSLAMAQDPKAIKPIEPNLVIKLPLSQYINKIRAIKAHKSQMENSKKTTLETLKRLLYIRNEYFYLFSY